MMQQRKIWVCLHGLPWNRVVLLKGTRRQKPGMANENRRNSKSHFMVCEGSCSVRNYTAFFFVSIVCIHVQNLQLPYKRTCSNVKKFLFLQRMTLLWQFDIYYFCFAKVLKGRTMITVLNGICVMKACEWTWVFDLFLCWQCSSTNHYIKSKKMVHVYWCHFDIIILHNKIQYLS